MSAQAPDPIAFHEGVRAAALASLDRDTRRARLVSWLRVALALAAIAPFFVAWPVAVQASVGALAALAFAGAVAWHRRVQERGDDARRREAAARHALARMARRWDELPPSRIAVTGEGWGSVLARDLDIAGDRSLLRLLDVVHPGVGGARLVRWLLDDPAALATIAERQQSVAELRRRGDLLVATAAESRRARPWAAPRALERFLAWCGEPPARERPLLVGRVVAVVAATALVGALLAGQGQRLVPVVAAAMIVLLTVSVVARRRIAAVAALDPALAELTGVVRVLERVQAEPDVPGHFGGIQRRLREEHAVTALHAFARLLEWNTIRFTPAVHWVLNGVAGFDAHLAHALVRWQARHGTRAVEWLDLAADAEALLALATLGFEHPECAMPEVHEAGDAPVLEATALAHPLLRPGIAVANDADLGAAGDVLVISGANMAGKTTFLRALGLAALLAQAGGVACAGAMRLRRCRVRTSMRVEDDLGRGVSLFLAEVMRLRDVVHDAEVPMAPPVLYLLDEVLHGTNAGDRRQATQTVLRALSDAGAAGAVTTHDTGIGDVQLGRGRVAHVHFDGTVVAADGEVSLRFDYRAQPGPAGKANALQILETVLGGRGALRPPAAADDH